MFRLLVEHVVHSVGVLSGLRSHAQHLPPDGPFAWSEAEKELSHLKSVLQLVEAKASLRFLDQVIAYTKPGSVYSVSTTSTAMNMLLQSMEAELKGTLFLGVVPERVGYTDGAPFGTPVESAFPDAIVDIEEAGWCLALERPTASIFHLMRAMERAVHALAQQLEIQNIDQTWGGLLHEMDRKIQNMPRGEMRDEWSAVRTHLHHVKQAWRNNTMHPKQYYNQLEAQEIYGAVKVFMRNLANLVASP